MSDIFLSVVVPAYNEEKRLKKTLLDFMKFFEQQPYQTEIIVVDDGSRDETEKVARETLQTFRHKIFKNEGNRGKGYSVRRGMLGGEGKFLLFSDADHSTPIEETTRFLEELEKGYDCVIGSRALKESNVEVHQPFFRETMGRIFNRIAQTVSFRGVQDSQCGFKCFTKTAAQELFSLQKLDGFSFDAEIVYLAQKKGYRLLEMPVTWRNSPQTRVRVFQDSLHMFFDILKIRWLHRR